jgi:hypothetical protein
MKTVLVSSFVLLGLGLFPGAKQSVSPEKVIERGIALVTPCDYEVKATIEEDGKSKAVKLGQGESEMKSKLSLELLLRPGRYDFHSVGKSTVAGKPALVVGFTPRAAGQPLPLPGEDERINRALNNVEGKFTIDEATGGIMHAEAKVRSVMSFTGKITKFGIPAPVTVTVLSGHLRVSQRWSRGRWLPDHATLSVWAVVIMWYVPMPVPVHYTYHAPFSCAGK